MRLPVNSGHVRSTTQTTSPLKTAQVLDTCLAMKYPTYGRRALRAERLGRVYEDRELLPIWQGVADLGTDGLTQDGAAER